VTAVENKTVVSHIDVKTLGENWLERFGDDFMRIFLETALNSYQVVFSPAFFLFCFGTYFSFRGTTSFIYINSHFKNAPQKFIYQ